MAQFEDPAVRASKSSTGRGTRLLPMLVAGDVPEVNLLRSPHVAWIVPLLEVLRQPMKVEDFHQLVASALADLRRDYPQLIGAHGVVPAEPLGAAAETEGRDRSLVWLGNGWLMRVNDESGEEQLYALTTAATEVLTMVARIVDPRTSASRTQFEAIQDMVESLVAVSSEDPQLQMARLVSQRAAVQSGIDQLQQRINTGVRLEVDAQAVGEHVGTLFTLTESLPVSFRLVERGITTAHRQMIEGINAADEGVSRGSMLEEKIGAVNGLLEATDAGRTFAALDEWLSSTTAHQALAEGIEAFLASPGAFMVSPEDRVRVRDLPRTLRAYIRAVQSHYADLAGGIQQYLMMTSTERTALHSVLSELDYQVRAALEAGQDPGVKVGIGAGIAVESITRYALPAPAGEDVLAPVSVADATLAQEVTAAPPISSRMPLSRLIEALNAAMLDALETCGTATGAEVFAALAPAQRSVATLVDLVRVAIEHDGDTEPVLVIDGGTRQSVTTVAADGSTRDARIPTITFTRPIPSRSDP